MHQLRWWLFFSQPQVFCSQPCMAHLHLHLSPLPPCSVIRPSPYRVKPQWFLSMGRRATAAPSTKRLLLQRWKLPQNKVQGPCSPSPRAKRSHRLHRELSPISPRGKPTSDESRLTCCIAWRRLLPPPLSCIVFFCR